MNATIPSAFGMGIFCSTDSTSPCTMIEVHEVLSQIDYDPVAHAVDIRT
ncbi:MAG: hypothetical protein ACP5SH_12570 [Syntrophobacteraceae bacterium]